MEGLKGADRRIPAENREEIETFRNELAQVFEGPFAILGHGTNIGNAPTILKEGLRARTGLLQTTAIPLENTSKGIREILHWPHHDHKAIIVIAIPFSTPSNAEFFDEIKTEYSEELPYVLPPRFIRGYIDAENRRFIPNPDFETNPAYRIKEVPKSPFDDASESPTEEVEIPRPGEGGETPGDIF